MKPLTILIADDDVDDKDMFCEAIAEINPAYQCTWAKDGIQAIELLENNIVQPDYIFLDINMPRLNGKQCLTKIRASKQFQHVPVYIYSTSKLALDKDEMTQLGANGFITKPSNYKALVALLIEILSHKTV